MYKKLLFFTAMLSLHLLPIQAPTKNTPFSHNDVTISHSGENFVRETDIKCAITLDEIEQLQKIDVATKSIKASELILNAITKKIPTSIAINCPENPEYNLIIQITFTPDTVQSETKTTINVYKTPKILPTLPDLLIAHAIQPKKTLSKYAKIGLGVAGLVALFFARSKFNERAERRNNNLKNWLFPTPSATEKESAKVRIAQKINTDLKNVVAIPFCVNISYWAWIEELFDCNDNVNFNNLVKYISTAQSKKIILLISCNHLQRGPIGVGGQWEHMAQDLNALYSKIPANKFNILFIDLQSKPSDELFYLHTEIKRWMSGQAESIKHSTNDAIHFFDKVEDEQINTLFDEIIKKLNLT